MVRSTFRTTLTRLALGALGGALLLGGGVAAAPAATGGEPTQVVAPEGRGYHQGTVTVDRVRLHEAPDARSRVLTSEYRGAQVTVVCRATGGTAGGGNEWYVLKNGYYAWAPATSVKVRGGPPPWC